MQEALFPALFLEIILSNHPQLFLCTIFKMFCLLAVLLIYLYVTERPKIKAKRCTKFFNEAKFLFEVAFQFWVFQNSAIMHTEYITYVVQSLHTYIWCIWLIWSISDCHLKFAVLSCHINSQTRNTFQSCFVFDVSCSMGKLESN